MQQPLDVHRALAHLRSSIEDARESLVERDPYRPSDWLVENCFLEALAISEASGLLELHKMMLKEYEEIKSSSAGFGKHETDPEEGPWLVHLARLMQFVFAIEIFYPPEEQTSITRDLLKIIRNIHYSITDIDSYGKVPADEDDVHRRIELILKPVFPDLRHKPRLTKPIKNFEPDTGIPSLQTLIEYKYLSSKAGVAKIADEILADTRGYVSKDWKRYIFVIYETRRFRPEDEWNELLRAAGVPKNTAVVVLSGEAPAHER